MMGTTVLARVRLDDRGGALLSCEYLSLSDPWALVVELGAARALLCHHGARLGLLRVRSQLRPVQQAGIRRRRWLGDSLLLPPDHARTAVEPTVLVSATGTSNQPCWPFVGLRLLPSLVAESRCLTPWQAACLLGNDNTKHLSSEVLRLLHVSIPATKKPFGNVSCILSELRQRYHGDDRGFLEAAPKARPSDGTRTPSSPQLDGTNTHVAQLIHSIPLSMKRG